MSLGYKTLRPGILVGLKTKISGDNVEYAKTVIEEEHVNENGELIAKWQTDKTVADAEEQERAVKVRSAARNLVTGVCAKSDFGYLCPDNKEAELEAAVEKANILVNEFNLTASLSEIEFYTIYGRIAADDEKAIRAIKNEVNGLLEAMAKGVQDLNVEDIRSAANKAKRLGTMLAPDVQARVQEYIDQVRKVAVEINKAGDQAATVVDATILASLANRRTEFLDIDEAAEIKDTVVEGRALDLDPEVAAPVIYDRDNATGDFNNPDNFIDLGLDDVEPTPLTVADEAPARELDLEDILS